MAGKPATKESFVKKAREVHGDRYDYSKSEYVNIKTPLTITCLDHGDFIKTPHIHNISKIGCPACKGREVSDLASFERKARVVHDARYTYEKAIYINNKTKLLIGYAALGASVG